MKDEIKEILDISIGDDREAYIDYIDKDGKRKNYEYIEAEDLSDYITNLQEEKDKYKLRCYKAKKMIFDNYGLLDKYGIEMLEDILDGKSDE